MGTSGEGKHAFAGRNSILALLSKDEGWLAAVL